MKEENKQSEKLNFLVVNRSGSAMKVGDFQLLKFGEQPKEGQPLNATQKKADFIKAHFDAAQINTVFNLVDLEAEAEKEAERLAKEEAERLAKEEAEKERLAKEEAEKERLAKEEAEKERLAKEEAEKERLAKEEAEKERLAKEEAEKASKSAAKKNTQKNKDVK
ncbi:hypothetical protein KO527_05400 [Pseudoalteromonas sp. C2R02]|uniref:hypothetical protein n=1 Tax=Pseudoalteromonas sp. C2R02 TaxID=2841565 RepID=UPI001C097FA7|nr:hypothetical protein [Pseudoalteromonas sp. C2R02]MBU2968784.1 hypothetical protein [Pseudoalteromonas sp. C2R02]